MSARPHAETGCPIVIPKALEPLTLMPRWVVWRWEQNEKGEFTKVPYCADRPNDHASSTDPKTWCSFDTAMQCYSGGRFHGIGFMLPGGSGIGALDLDDCRDPESCNLQDWAQALVARCGSYVEVTPSRCGIRIIGKATGAKLHRKFKGAEMQAVYGAPNGASVEVYRDAERYITITGNQIEPAVDRLTDISAIAEDIVAKLDAAKTAAKQGKSIFDAVGKPAPQPSLDEIIKHGHHELWGGDRSKGTWYVINKLIEQGKSDDEITAILVDPDNGISAHTLSKKEDPRKYAQRQITKARAEQTAKREGTAGDGSLDADGTEIARLAKLSDLAYEKERKPAAERMGFRATILDRLVTAEREQTRLGLDKKTPGRSIAFPDLTPWPEPVEGAAVLDDIAKEVRSYVVMSEAEADSCALWGAHTYRLDCFQITPRLGIWSATKRCGKTTLLDCLGRLVWRPLQAANVTPSAVFRVVEGYRPTLLIDEADTFLRDNAELRGVLNSGHRKGGQVIRSVGDDFEPRAFATYAGAAIATIGKLPPTLQDRSIEIELKRRRPGDKVKKFRFDRVGHLDQLARKMARWCDDHKVEIAAAEAPAELESFSNAREADNWRTLLAIAAIAGGDWPRRGLAAATAARAKPNDGDELLEMLISDICAVFPESKKPAEMSSAALVEKLVALEGRPWAEMGKNAKPLTQNKLARLLKPLAIGPDNIGEERNKGYKRHQFDEAFERYLPQTPVEGASQPLNRSKSDETGTSDIFETAHPRRWPSGWKTREVQ